VGASVKKEFGTKKSKFLNWVPIYILPFFVLLLYIPIDGLHKLWISSGLVFLGFALTFVPRIYKKAKSIDEKDSKVDTSSVQHGKEYLSTEIILGTMYAIVAGFAITEALEEYNDSLSEIMKPLISSETVFIPISTLLPAFSKNTNVIFLLAGFFALAIPFYHGGTLTLLKSGNDKHKILIFIMMFFIGIVLYFIGTNVANIYIFSTLTAALMIIDPVWCFYMRYGVNDKRFLIEWIQLNAITAGFFLLFLLLHINLSPQDNVYFSLTIFIVLALRTILDYYFGWELYSMRP